MCIRDRPPLALRRKKLALQYCLKLSANTNNPAYNTINSGKSITFFWIPSHVGIRGNEDADIAAKAGLNVAITNMRFSVSNLFTCVNQLCVKEWQQLWNQCTSNKLYSVQPAVGRSLFRHWATTTQSSSCLLYTSPSPRDRQKSRMPSSA